MSEENAAAAAPVRPPAASGTRLGRWAAGIGRSLLYSLLSLLLGVLGFGLTIAFLALGAGTVIIWIGLPILVFAVLVARMFAATGRGLHSGLLGTPLPTPARKRPAQGAGRVRRLLTPLTDPQSWMNVAWILLSLILSIVTFPIALTWTVGAIATVGAPIAMIVLLRLFPLEQVSGLGILLGFTGQTAIAVDFGLQILAGLLFLVTVGPVTRGIAFLHRGLGRGLLSSRYEEQQRLVRTEESRAAGRAAESEALRRLERDLHDGPQQHLVRASIDLARVEGMSGSDPERARSTLRETRERLGETLDELRRLSRGIAPPILVDRGLPAALSELATTCPIPTRVRSDAPDLPEHVEIGIYYVVSEALANAAKHSGADGIRVEVRRVGDVVRVRVDDDGAGGAQLRPGGGLAGLAGRVASLEGTFDVSSPAGEGTLIEAEIPCAS